MKPLIAITTYGRNEKEFASAYYPQHFALPALYVDAVRRAGGECLLLPPGNVELESVLTRVDGLLITGGADVNPAEYQGDVQHPCLTPIDIERDESELALVRQLLRGQRLPSLCICRGMQLLNVALGGSLYEHVADILPEDMHRADDGGWTVHNVDIVPGSKLAQVVQATRVETYSGHHQAVKQLAPGLKVCATAGDGTIEAVEHESLSWLIGVQWHPEITAAQDPTQLRLFAALVREAAVR